MNKYCQPCEHGLESFEEKVLTFESVVMVAAKYFKVEPESIFKNSRRGDVVQIRHMIIKYLRSEMSMKLNAIGILCGGRDHTTIIHSNQRFGDLYDTDEHFRAVYAGMKKEINNFKINFYDPK